MLILLDNLDKTYDITRHTKVSIKLTTLTVSLLIQNRVCKVVLYQLPKS